MKQTNKTPQSILIMAVLLTGLFCFSANQATAQETCKKLNFQIEIAKGRIKDDKALAKKAREWKQREDAEQLEEEVREDENNLSKMQDKYLVCWESLARSGEKNLDGAYLPRVNFKSVQLSNANLTGANLFNSNLTNADLTNADLRRANLSGADLTGAVLINANFTGAGLTRSFNNGMTPVQWKKLGGIVLPGGFNQSCKEIKITHSTLSAQCQTSKVDYVATNIDLSKYIGNQNGYLSWGDSRFSQTCYQISIKGSILTAACKDRVKQNIFSKIDLDAHIANIDGVLTYEW